jgi:hypothetical protein
MSIPHHPLSELDELASALCDEDVSQQQLARLEELVAASVLAEQYFLDYVRLHAELCWKHLPHPGPCTVPYQLSEVWQSAPPRPESLGRKAIAGRRWLGISAVLASVLLMVAAAGWIGHRRGWLAPHGGLRGGTETPRAVARLEQTGEAQWAAGRAWQKGSRLTAGERLSLRAGLAQLIFDGGASLILQGPAEFQPESANSGALLQGRLSARVPGRPASFTVQLPQASVHDLGTEFGVAVGPGGESRVEVFVGKVEVRLKTGGTRLRLWAGEAAMVQRAADGLPRLVRVAATTVPFVRELPSPLPPMGSVRRLRAIVATDAHLIHHFTFEGQTLGEKLSDRRGNLALGEVAMRDGRGGGGMDYAAAGFHDKTPAVRPYRALQHGNNRGVALQSQATFWPPRSMTVELLASYVNREENPQGAILAAVATRASRRNGGFLVAALGQGQLAVLLDSQAEWLESGFRLASDDWYYLASTFESRDGHTVVNGYAARLSAGQRTLQRIFQDRLVVGTPAASPLGIGKGFDGDLAHAYPWSGALGDIALYDVALDRDALQLHLDALLQAAPATVQGKSLP